MFLKLLLFQYKTVNSLRLCLVGRMGWDIYIYIYTREDMIFNKI